MPKLASHYGQYLLNIHFGKTSPLHMEAYHSQKEKMAILLPLLELTLKI